jgi:3-deoxy-manno-octulosonate cytidylyltransferase (CMP-KDO synthetase)
MKICTLVPSRMGSTRLPNKPLADIVGLPMICHVYDRATEAGLGDVVVACDDERIKQAVEAHGGRAIITDSALPSGSDRIWQATQRLMEEGLEQPDIIINVQGDEPLLPPELIQQAVKAFEDNAWADVVTFAHMIDQKAEMENDSMVKIAVDSNNCAHYFSRSPIPNGASEMRRHIGFYAYRYKALEAFVATKPTYLEETEKLEQLRGLDIGLKYYVAMTHHEPVGVDTQADLDRVRVLMAK